MDFVLDAKGTALVLIDLQNGVVSRQTAPYSPQDVILNSLKIADALREKGGAIIFVRVLIAEVIHLPVDSPMVRPANPSPEASDLVPQIKLQAGDHVVIKRQWGAFYGTNLDQILRRRNIRSIILGGIATNFGVESTARAAFDRGYELVFAEKAMTSVSAEAHNFSTQTIFPRMGRVRSTEEIVSAFR